METAPGESGGTLPRDPTLSDRFKRVTEKLQSGRMGVTKDEWIIDFGTCVFKLYLEAWDDTDYVAQFLKYIDLCQVEQQRFYYAVADKLAQAETDMGIQVPPVCPGVQGVASLETTDKSDPEIAALRAEVADLKAHVRELTTQMNFLKGNWNKMPLSS
jgi:hypothetical protein